MGDGNGFIKYNVVYKAEIEEENNIINNITGNDNTNSNNNNNKNNNDNSNNNKTYIGLTEQIFKTRYNNHTSTFQHEKHENHSS